MDTIYKFFVVLISLIVSFYSNGHDFSVTLATIIPKLESMCMVLGFGAGNKFL